MRKKSFFVLGISILIVFLISSCLSDPGIGDQPDQTYEQEMQKLSDYLDSLVVDGYDIDTTALGVYYITIEEGEGDFPEDGDLLEVSYTGYLMNGYLFDSSQMSTETGTWEFELGNTLTIPGWEDGMKVMNKGAKVQLIIPSPLAYGELGYGVIPPNNTLIFVVNMLNITTN